MSAIGLTPPGSPKAEDNAWCAAHKRLYEHLCTTTNEGDQPTLEDLQPLYQAVFHGCYAGLQQKACDNVYFARLLRGNDGYSAKKLGALASDLGAVVGFFEQPWSCISPSFPDGKQARLLNNAAFYLRGLGRLTEALEPMRTGLDNYVKQDDSHYAAVLASNLSALELLLGDVKGAVRHAKQAVSYARSGGANWLRHSLATLADALHQSGRRDESEEQFREADKLPIESQPQAPMLYSQQGFRYGGLLLARSERAVWEKMQNIGDRSQKTELESACRAVFQRATLALEWSGRNNAALVDIAIHRLVRGRALLYEAILNHSPISNPHTEIDTAVSGLRCSGDMTRLPRGLLTRAIQRFVAGKRTGSESAQSDLDEAWEIAERGPMPLFLADICLHRARLFGVQNAERGVKCEGEDTYPWDSPAADLAAAETLINACGYHRRDEELADAKAALL